MTQLVRKFLKLNNGENIICATDIEKDYFDNKSIHVIDPVIVHSIRIPRMGMIVETFIMKYWIPFSKDNMAEIQTSSISAIFDPDDKFIEQYEMFIADQKLRHNQEILEDIEDEKQDNNLEDLMRSMLRNREDNEEDENDGPERVLH